MPAIRLALVLVVGVAACSGAPPAQRPRLPTPAREVPYRFTLDGKPFEPTVISLDGELRPPRPGDLIQVDDFLLLLGPEPEQRLVRGGRDLAPTLSLEEGGRRRLLAAKIGWAFEGDKKVIADPLEGRSPAELRGLRGLTLDEWPPKIASTLAALDPERVVLTITNTVAQGKARRFPPLPGALRYLRVNEWSSEGIADYGPLSSHRALRFLAVKNLSRDPLDLRTLAGMRELRVLDLSGVEVKGDEALANLRELRVLKLGYSNLARIEGLRALRALRRLDLQRTRVADLRPLDGLDALEEVDADLSKVARLPRIPLPGLRRLRLLSTPVSDAAVREFARANPRCEVLHRWSATLRTRLGEGTGLRARTGGTCHRSPANEQTIFEVKGAAEVRAFLELVEIDEGGSGFHCMCCGSESFELRRGTRLLGTIGFHHGQSLRWPGGWPADAKLTEDSAEKLVRWLADHGMSGPAKERLQKQQRRRAADRRMERYRQILAPGMLDRLTTTRSLKEALAIFAELGGEEERALVYLRLFGCDQGSWNRHAGLDDAVFALLSQVEKRALAGALARAMGEAQARTGAARWAFGENKHATLDPKALRAALPRLGLEGLTHPRPISRRRTLTALGRIQERASTALLRSSLAGKAAPRPLPIEEQVEPDGSIFFTPDDSEVEEGCSEPAHAALLLARRKDRPSLPAIRKLLAGAEGGSRRVLRQAVETFTGKAPASQPWLKEDSK